MRKLYLSLVLLLTFSIGNIFAQPVVTEEFEYTVGDLLTAHGYTTNTGTSNFIAVINGNLTYPIYPSAGLGGMIKLFNTGEDVYKPLSAPITTGTVYASFLVNFDSAQTLGDYFFHLISDPFSTSYRARVFVKKALNGNLAFGLSKGTVSATNPAIYGDSIYTVGTTYLIVVAYEIIDGTSNDVVKLWVNPSLAGPEPTPLLNLTDATQTDISVGSYAFRQGGAASGPYLKLDGLIIGTSWNYVVPVELTSFTALVSGKNVNLTWTTATEINNAGFEVERKSTSSNWQKIGFVNGNGTTTEKQTYSFTDKSVTEGNYSYRLKQVDFNGVFEYSNFIEVNVLNPDKFELNQNYPNPFNPNTSIKFSLPSAGNVKLSVYNLLGQEVQTLINGFKEAGIHTVNFEAKNINSGIYLYKLEANGLTSVKKMTLLK